MNAITKICISPQYSCDCESDIVIKEISGLYHPYIGGEINYFNNKYRVVEIKDFIAENDCICRDVYVVLTKRF